MQKVRKEVLLAIVWFIMMERATITARCGLATAETTIAFAGKPASLKLDMYPDKILVGQEAYIRAIVKDEKGNRVADGTEVAFTIKQESKSHLLKATTLFGEAVVSLKCDESHIYKIEVSVDLLTTTISISPIKSKVFSTRQKII